jgi:hypothetical protein
MSPDWHDGHIARKEFERRAMKMPMAQEPQTDIWWFVGSLAWFFVLLMLLMEMV